MLVHGVGATPSTDLSRSITKVRRHRQHVDGNILEGEIPAKKLRMLLTWMDIHQEELVANWNLLSNDDQYFNIEPLR